MCPMAGGSNGASTPTALRFAAVTMRCLWAAVCAAESAGVGSLVDLSDCHLTCASRVNLRVMRSFAQNVLARRSVM